MKAKTDRVDPDDIKMVNCADCGCELLGESNKLIVFPHEQLKELPGIVSGRILGRPYCKACLLTNRIRTGTSSLPDDNPTQENAIRVLEGE